MSLDLREKSQKRMRVIITVLVALVVGLVGLVVGLVVATQGDDSDGGDSGKPPGDPSPSPSQTQDDGAYRDPQSWVKMPKGEDKENGLPVGFPRTPRGAAAVAVNMNRNAWTWDEEKIRTGIKTYMVESYKKEMLSTAKPSAQAARKMAGIPESGPIPDGANINGWPVGVQWKKLKDDHYQVFTLTRVTSTSGSDADTKTQLESMPGEVVWKDGDWKVTPSARGEVPDAPEPAEVGSEEFDDQGWRAIQEGDRR